MNDRIKQLAEQAGFISWEDESWKPQDAVFDWGTTYDAELEKFAELIVQECIDTLHWHDSDDAVKYIEWMVVNKLELRKGSEQ